MEYFDKEKLGKRIRAARKRKNMTQNELAEKLDYSSSHQIQRIESGTTGCSIDRIVEAAQVLNVSTDYLLRGEDRNIQINHSECLFCKLSEEQRRMFREAINVIRSFFEQMWF
jgi:transcriptional regulator with XRE-family HTH domain